MKYLVHKDFTESLSKLANKGFNYSGPYNQALHPYLKACENQPEKEVFKGLKVTNKGEKRIKHAIKFDLGRACRLVIIKNKNMCHFLYAGVHKDVEKWLDQHRGFKTVIGKNTGLIDVLHRTDTGNDEQTPLVNQNINSIILCDQLDADDQNYLFRNLESSILFGIYKLNSMDTNDTIWDSLQAIEDSEIATALFDILLLLRQPNKNSVKIKKIISDMRGEVIPFEDATEDEIEISEGGDEVSIIKLDNFDSDVTRRTLESKNFRNWMLYMHPTQEKFVDKDFNGPTLLKGVSGSGKTAVVVNRAIRLAKIKPDEKVMVFTLNKALAKLIEDLVESAAGELNNLSVMSLWPFCTEQLAIFDPEHLRHYGEETWRTRIHVDADHIDDIWQEFFHQELRVYDSEVLFPKF